MIGEVERWKEYADLHVANPDPQSAAKVDFYNVNRNLIITSNGQTEHDSAIVIPAYNEANYLPRTLASVNRLLGRTSERLWPRVVVVDNNSSDETGEIARHFGATVVTEVRKGISSARQAGLNAVTERVILSTDADTVLPMNWVEAYAQALQNSNVLMAYGRLNFLADCKASQPTGLGHKVYDVVFGGVRWAKSNFRRFSCPSSANMGFVTEAAKAAGGYNTEISRGEDYDLLDKLQNRGEVEWLKDLFVWTSDRRGLHMTVGEKFIRSVKRNLIFILGRNRQGLLGKPGECYADYRVK